MNITGQEIGRPVRVRMPVPAAHPDYDKHILAFIKSKIVIDPVRGCWLWQGFIQPDTVLKSGKKAGQIIKGGYGKMSYRGRSRPVHRVVWTIANGEPPKKMDVCHECDVRNCCWLDHLWLGTRKQNLLDMADKKRGNKASKTECLRGHPLSGDNVILSNGGRRRGCKECQRLRGQREDVKAMQRAAQKRRRARLRAERSQGASA